jgi:hypothetical protein
MLGYLKKQNWSQILYYPTFGWVPQKRVSNVRRSQDKTLKIRPFLKQHQIVTRSNQTRGENGNQKKGMGFGKAMEVGWWPIPFGWMNKWMHECMDRWMDG